MWELLLIFLLVLIFLYYIGIAIFPRTNRVEAFESLPSELPTPALESILPSSTRKKVGEIEVPVSFTGSLSHPEFISQIFGGTLSPGNGIPKSLQMDGPPICTVEMYEGALIAKPGEDFGAYIHQGQAYLVQPLSRFANGTERVIRLEPECTAQLGENIPNNATIQRFPRIEDQLWFAMSRENALMQYDNQLLQREDDSTVNGYVYRGNVYALWSADCQSPTPVSIPTTDPVYYILPSRRTFFKFPLAYKQSWFSSILPGCSQNERYQEHF